VSSGRSTAPGHWQPPPPLGPFRPAVSPSSTTSRPPISPRSSAPWCAPGFRLAKPATEITAAEVLEAVEGRGQLFSCTEIRQRGPVALTGAACRTPCGIARLMDRAELAWRNELATTTIADLVETSGVGAPERLSRWLETSEQKEA
jgi:Iron-dependent Transcriptional regulator